MNNSIHTAEPTHAPRHAEPEGRKVGYTLYRSSSYGTRKYSGGRAGALLRLSKERWATTPTGAIALVCALACARVVALDTNIGGILCRRISPHDTSFPSPLNWMWNDISHDLVPVVSAASECRSLSLASPATGSRVRPTTAPGLRLCVSSRGIPRTVVVGFLLHPYI